MLYYLTSIVLIVTQSAAESGSLKWKRVHRRQGDVGFREGGGGQGDPGQLPHGQATPAGAQGQEGHA